MDRQPRQTRTLLSSFLSGNSGRDTLLGDAGIDTANGGSGKDTCVAENKSSC